MAVAVAVAVAEAVMVVAVLQVEVTPVQLRRTRRELMAIREWGLAHLFGEPLQACAREWPRHGIRFTARQSAIGPHWARTGSGPLSMRQLIIQR